MGLNDPTSLILWDLIQPVDYQSWFSGFLAFFPSSLEGETGFLDRKWIDGSNILYRLLKPRAGSKYFVPAPGAKSRFKTIFQTRRAKKARNRKSLLLGHCDHITQYKNPMTQLQNDEAGSAWFKVHVSPASSFWTGHRIFVLSDKVAMT